MSFRYFLISFETTVCCRWEAPRPLTHSPLQESKRRGLHHMDGDAKGHRRVTSDEHGLRENSMLRYALHNDELKHISFPRSASRGKDLASDAALPKSQRSPLKAKPLLDLNLEPSNYSEETAAEDRTPTVGRPTLGGRGGTTGAGSPVRSPGRKLESHNLAGKKQTAVNGIHKSEPAPDNYHGDDERESDDEILRRQRLLDDELAEEANRRLGIDDVKPPIGPVNLRVEYVMDDATRRTPDSLIGKILDSRLSSNAKGNERGAADGASPRHLPGDGSPGDERSDVANPNMVLKTTAVLTETATRLRLVDQPSPTADIVAPDRWRQDTVAPSSGPKSRNMLCERSPPSQKKNCIGENRRQDLPPLHDSPRTKYETRSRTLDCGSNTKPHLQQKQQVEENSTPNQSHILSGLFSHGRKLVAADVDLTPTGSSPRDISREQAITVDNLRPEQAVLTNSQSSDRSDPLSMQRIASPFPAREAETDLERAHGRVDSPREGQVLGSFESRIPPFADLKRRLLQLKDSIGKRTDDLSTTEKLSASVDVAERLAALPCQQDGLGRFPRPPASPISRAASASANARWVLLQF